MLQLDKLVSDMQNVYSTAKICDFKNPEKCDLNLEPGKHAPSLCRSLCESVCVCSARGKWWYGVGSRFQLSVSAYVWGSVCFSCHPHPVRLATLRPQSNI